MIRSYPLNAGDSHGGVSWLYDDILVQAERAADGSWAPSADGVAMPTSRIAVPPPTSVALDAAVSVCARKARRVRSASVGSQPYNKRYAHSILRALLEGEAKEESLTMSAMMARVAAASSPAERFRWFAWRQPVQGMEAWCVLRSRPASTGTVVDADLFLPTEAHWDGVVAGHKNGSIVTKTPLFYRLSAAQRRALWSEHAALQASVAALPGVTASSSRSAATGRHMQLRLHRYPDDSFRLSLCFPHDGYCFAGWPTGLHLVFNAIDAAAVEAVVRREVVDNDAAQRRYLNTVTGDPKMPRDTEDVDAFIDSGAMQRAKFFFGFRYSWGRSKVEAKGLRITELASDGIAADTHEAPPALAALLDAALTAPSSRSAAVSAVVPPSYRIHQTALNWYRTCNCPLAAHIDDMRFFQHVVTMRLFTHARLVFDGKGNDATEATFYAPLARGALLVMDSDSIAIGQKVPSDTGAPTSTLGQRIKLSMRHGLGFNDMPLRRDGTALDVGSAALIVRDANLTSLAARLERLEKGEVKATERSVLSAKQEAARIRGWLDGADPDALLAADRTLPKTQLSYAPTPLPCDAPAPKEEEEEVKREETRQESKAKKKSKAVAPRRQSRRLAGMPPTQSAQAYPLGTRASKHGVAWTAERHPEGHYFWAPRP